MKFIRAVYTIILPSMVILLVALGISSAFIVTDESVKFCVTSKKTFPLAGKQIHLVTAQNGNNYEVANSQVLNRFDAEEDFNSITVGKCYESRMQGINIPAVELFQNILQPTEIK